MLVAWSTIVSTMSPTSLLWSSMPISRKRWAIDCDAHTLDACSPAGSSLRLPRCTVFSRAADTMFWIIPITSFEPHAHVFSIAIAMYILPNQNEAIKLVRETVLM